MAGAVPTVGQGGHVAPQLSIWEVLGAHVQEQLILQQHMSPGHPAQGRYPRPERAGKSEPKLQPARPRMNPPQLSHTSPRF